MQLNCACSYVTYGVVNVWLFIKSFHVFVLFLCIGGDLSFIYLGGPGPRPPLFVLQSSFIPFSVMESQGSGQSLLTRFQTFWYSLYSQIALQICDAGSRRVIVWYYGLQAVYSSTAVKSRGSVHILTPLTESEGVRSQDPRIHTGSPPLFLCLFVYVELMLLSLCASTVCVTVSYSDPVYVWATPLSYHWVQGPDLQNILRFVLRLLS